MDSLENPFDAEYIVKKSKKLRRELIKEMEQRKRDPIKTKIAVLGGSTTADIVACLDLFLLHSGIAAEFYESDYARYYEDAVFSNAELDAFSPDIVYIHTSNRNILEWPKLEDNESQVESRLEKTCLHFEEAWEQLKERFHCVIIQNNMELPFFRLLGNQDAADIHGRVNFIGRINERFSRYAKKHDHFYLNDLHYLSASYGLERWAEPFYWYMYKYSLCVPAIPFLSQSVANIIKAVYGKNKKAIVVDLDHTLWGGVIGDEGAEQIELGQETAAGQAYQDFQEYLKLHKEMGILLTVSSKNDPENAKKGLLHENSLLKPEDFLVIRANWEDKGGNVREIANELNILPESMVFIDDNPAERELVSMENPGIAVPQISSVERYIQEIDRQGYFEVVSLSEDDRARNQMYSSNLKRAKESSRFENYGEYLRSLEMKAAIGPFLPDCITRVTQLTNKSNQFNLTTRRYTQAEIETISRDPSYVTLQGRLKDKFGDNGIVSVIIGRISGSVCHIELWLMSCRVLKREMETAMLDQLAEVCKKRKLRTLAGYYYPTEKNRMVKDFYPSMGFLLSKEQENGTTEWLFELDENYDPKNKLIEITGE